MDKNVLESSKSFHISDNQNYEKVRVSPKARGQFK